MELGLNGKVILISGGAKGIGAAIVRAVMREGAIPAVVDRDRDACGKLEAELKAAAGKCFFIAEDLGDAENCRKAVAAVAAKFGRLDALVNNAGINDGVSLEKGGPQRIHRIA